MIDRSFEAADNMKTFSKAIDTFISNGAINKLQNILNSLPKDVKDTKLYDMVEELYTKKDISYEDVAWVTNFYSADGSLFDCSTCFDNYAEDNELLNYIRYIIELDGVRKREKIILLLSHFEPLVYYTLSMKKEKTRGPLKTEVNNRLLDYNSGMSAECFAKLFIAAIVFIVFARTEDFSFIDPRMPFRNNILHNGVMGYSDQDIDVAYELLVRYVCVLVWTRMVV